MTLANLVKGQLHTDHKIRDCGLTPLRLDIGVMVDAGNEALTGFTSRNRLRNQRWDCIRH